MSSIFRKVCCQFLELDCNSKVVTPHTKQFSTMQSENLIPFDAAVYHKEQLHKLITTFLIEVDTGDCVELQNILLNVYLETDTSCSKDVVFQSTIISSFLAKLKTKWTNYVKFNTL